MSQVQTTQRAKGAETQGGHHKSAKQAWRDLFYLLRYILNKGSIIPVASFVNNYDILLSFTDKRRDGDSVCFLFYVLKKQRSFRKLAYSQFFNQHVDCVSVQRA